jgi:hypothetical protein
VLAVLVMFVVFVTVARAVLRTGCVLWCGVHVSPFRKPDYMITHLQTCAPAPVFPARVESRWRTRGRAVRRPLGS